VALLHENGITPAAPGRLLHRWEWVAGRWKMVSYAFVKFCEVVKYAKYVGYVSTHATIALEK